MKKTISILLVLFLIFAMGTPAFAKPLISKTVETNISLVALWQEGDANAPERVALLLITNVDQMTGQIQEKLTVTVNMMTRLDNPPEGTEPYAIESCVAEIPLSWLTIRQKPELSASLNRDLTMSMVALDQSGEPLGEPITIDAHVAMQFTAEETNSASSSTQTQIGNNMYMVKTDELTGIGSTSLDFTHGSITEHFAATPFDPANPFSGMLQISKRSTQAITH